jgi:hypothetical protein
MRRSSGEIPITPQDAKFKETNLAEVEIILIEQK